MMSHLSVVVAGVKLCHPIMNAAGTCKSLEDVKRLACSATAAIMIGSITLEDRKENSGTTYWSDPALSLNSLGLPNPGAQYYRQHLSAMADCAHEADKAFFVSVAGFSPEEYVELAYLAINIGADGVELNLSCPNAWKDGAQKRIACFDPLLIVDILKRIEKYIGTDARIFVKLSPFSDPFVLAEVARVIGNAEVVKAVTAVNTFPNVFALDDSGKPRIAPANGLAGLGGPALKPIGLGQVRQLRALLPERIQIIGVGGIRHGEDVRDYLAVGASAVQVGTAFVDRREEIFSSLLMELID